MEQFGDRGMKACRKCNEVKELSEFVHNKKCSDGRTWTCKQCRAAYMRKLEKKGPKRFQSSKSKQAAKARFRKNHPLIRRAELTFMNALKRGRITRQPCERCGETKVEGHHHDYSQPLDVIWLCKKHHMELHANLRSAKYSKHLQEAA